MLQRYSTSVLWLVITIAACAHPQPIADLGPAPSLAPRIKSLEVDRQGAVHLEVELARPAYVTVLAVERNRGVTLYASSAETASASLAAGAHTVRMDRVRPPSKPGGGRDMNAEVPASGWYINKPCPPPDPSGRDDNYCLPLPTEPILIVPPPPPTRYLVVLVTERPYTITELRARLDDADLSADGRELLSEVAAQIAGWGVPWAAYAVRPNSP